MDLANAINLGGLGLFSYVVWQSLQNLITVLRGLRDDMREDRKEVTSILQEHTRVLYQLRRANGHDDLVDVGRG